MGAFAHDSVLDGLLKVVKSNATQMAVCSSQPTTRSQAISTYKLAICSVSSTDFTIANGSASGRKVTVTAQNSVTVGATGSAQHVAVVDGSKLLIVTTCTKQALTKDNKVNIPEWKDTVADPTAS